MAEPSLLGGSGEEVCRKEEVVGDLGKTTDEEKTPAGEAGGGSSASGGREEDEREDYTWGPMPNLEDRFEGLNLCGEEETDLDFSAELEDLIREVRWLAIFKVHTTRQFSHSVLFNSMRNAWSPAQQVTFKPKGANLFIVQFSYLGD